MAVSLAVCLLFMHSGSHCAQSTYKSGRCGGEEQLIPNHACILSHQCSHSFIKAASKGRVGDGHRSTDDGPLVLCQPASQQPHYLKVMKHYFAALNFGILSSRCAFNLRPYLSSCMWKLKRSCAMFYVMMR